MLKKMTILLSHRQTVVACESWLNNFENKWLLVADMFDQHDLSWDVTGQPVNCL